MAPSSENKQLMKVKAREDLPEVTSKKTKNKLHIERQTPSCSCRKIITVQMLMYSIACNYRGSDKVTVSIDRFKRCVQSPRQTQNAR